MPIYEYDCPACGRFEVIQKFSDKPLGQCPTCKEKGKKNKVSRLVSSSAFHLKGGGWYKTDYSSGSGSGGKSKSSKTESTSDSSTSSDKGSDSDSDSGGKSAACGGNCACH